MYALAKYIWEFRSLVLLAYAVGFCLMGWYGYGALFALIAYYTRPFKPPQGN